MINWGKASLSTRAFRVGQELLRSLLLGGVAALALACADILYLIFGDPYIGDLFVPAVYLWLFGAMFLVHRQSHYRHFGALDQAHETLAAIPIWIGTAVLTFDGLNHLVLFAEINIAALFRPEIRHVWMTI